MSLKYLSGLNNQHSSECVPGALPTSQNAPLHPGNGALVAEQLSGTAFTVPRCGNLRSWLYRKHPSIGHKPFTKTSKYDLNSPNANSGSVTPTQLRWSPPGFAADFLATEKKDILEGLTLVSYAGCPLNRNGLAISTYLANTDMNKKAFYSSDGDFLFVLQEGTLHFMTEFGKLLAKPGEIVVIPRGIKWSAQIAESLSGLARGYVLEVYSGHFELPDLGPIGANGLADPRHFLYPVACTAEEDQRSEWQIVNKFGGEYFETTQDFCPFDVVAWHGNYAPFKYDLSLFSPYNCVGWDHSDPSIFTVLTVKNPAAGPGTAVCDFVIFPPRWSVAEHTFRIPYFHRNAMSEFMGLISGDYEAKANSSGNQVGFVPGGYSLHPIMSAHGPDTASYAKTVALKETELKPERVGENSLAFMFETYQMLTVSKSALESNNLQKEYWKCWANFKVQ